ncbi:MAG: GNAT family N-acetyltransferase [Clostridiales bacterium]|nr:GNAT family N-acetyltransferase [Clostridiales bacterium]
MIKLAKDESTLKKYKTCGDIYHTKIMSLASAYGFGYDFLRFYVQQSGAKVTAVLSVLDRDVIVSLDMAAADLGEISYFLRMTGFSSILCPGNLKLDFEFESGCVMKKSAAPLKTCAGGEIVQNVSLKKLYDFTQPQADFEYWYTDLNHRIRHGSARAYAQVCGGEIISAALLSAVWQNTAVLSSVKTAENHRRCGCASAVINQIFKDFGGDIYLMREHGKNKSFYERLGFEDIGLWKIYK